MLLQLLAVVYDGFEHSERNKFRKLLLHRRRCARRAFEMLLENGEEHMRVQHFIGALQEFGDGIGWCPLPYHVIPSIRYAESSSLRHCYLCFVALTGSDRAVSISRQQFYGVYDVALLRWQVRPVPVDATTLYQHCVQLREVPPRDYSRLPQCAQSALATIRRLVLSRWYEGGNCELSDLFNCEKGIRIPPLPRRCTVRGNSLLLYRRGIGDAVRLIERCLVHLTQCHHHRQYTLKLLDSSSHCIHVLFACSIRC